MRPAVTTARLSCLVLWLAAAAPAVAGPEFYAGAGLGYSAQGIDQPPLILGPGQTVPRDIDGTDLAWQVFAGARLHRHVAIEAAYVDLGSVNETLFALDGDGFPVQVTDSVSTTGVEATLVGIWPLNRDFELFGKVGFVAWEAERGLDGAITARPDGEDLAYGLGVDYRGSGRLRFRIQGMQYDLDGFDESIAVTAAIFYALPFGR